MSEATNGLPTSPPEASAIHSNEYEEIRLALAMSGGVSLAVWMGGVSMEINRAVQQDPTRAEGNRREATGVYRELLKFVRSKPRVDIIAGTSAGGLNGAVLAMAMIHDADVAALGDLWLREGSLTKLLRSPFPPDPPSLMKGDGYFLERLREAFANLKTRRFRPKEEVPISLTMTTTLLNGMPRTFTDEFGSVLPDEVHQGQFKFVRGPDLQDNFEREDIVDRLALAARSSASFPGAFEASFVPTGAGTRSPKRPDMKGDVSFGSSRYVVDGGVLVNKPIGPVIREILAQPSEDRPIRRVLAYVVPDPGVVPEDVADEEKEVPDLGKVIMASLVSIPRAESVASDLDEIVAHNRRARGQRALRERLLEGDAGLVGALTVQLFPLYRSLRARAVIEGLKVFMPAKDARAAYMTERAWVVLEERIRDDGSPWVSPSLEAMVGADKRVPAGTAEAAGLVVLDLMRRGFNLAPPNEVDEESPRSSLAALRRRANRLLGDIRVLRDLERKRWEDEATGLLQTMESAAKAATPEAPIDPPAQVSSWVAGRSRLWEGDSAAKRDPLKDMEDLAGVMLDAREPLLAVAEWVAGADLSVEEGKEGQLLESMTKRLVPEDSTRTDVIASLLQLAVVQYAMSAGMPTVDQQVEFIHISANAANGFDGRSTVQRKLAGVQLGHFGAFYRRSWRANDWMWGRLDGAQRMAQVFLNPARLRERGRETGLDGDRLIEWMVHKIHCIAVPRGDPESRAVLQPRWEDDEPAIRQELQFLKESGSPPPMLGVAAEAVARRIQLEILRGELVGIADSLDLDSQQGVDLSPDALEFLNGVEDSLLGGRTPLQMRLRLPWNPRNRVLPGDRLSPQDAADLFGKCRVGEERIAEEVGSDLLTSTATTAAAVGTSAASGKRSGLGPLRPILAGLRALMLTLFVMAQSAVRKGRTGFAIMTVSLAAGASVLAVGLVGGDVRWEDPLTLIAIGLLAIGILLAAFRAGAMIAAAYVVLAAAAAIIPYVWLQERIPEPPLSGGWEFVQTVLPLVPILGLIVAGVTLGLLQRVRIGRAVVRTLMAAIGVGGVVALALLAYDSPSVVYAVATPVAALVLGLVAGFLIWRRKRRTVVEDSGPGNPTF